MKSLMHFINYVKIIELKFKILRMRTVYMRFKCLKLKLLSDQVCQELSSNKKTLQDRQQKQPSSIMYVIDNLGKLYGLLT